MNKNNAPEKNKQLTPPTDNNQNKDINPKETNSPSETISPNDAVIESDVNSFDTSANNISSSDFADDALDDLV